MIPKFRAWVKANKQIYDVKSIVYTMRKMSLFNRDLIFPEKQAGFDEVILMQSTGLNDKNGQEIFEGDVVRLDVYNQLKCGIYEVRRGEAGDWQMQNRTRTKIISLIFSPGSTEIIGNIYESPELMEEVKGY